LHTFGSITSEREDVILSVIVRQCFGCD
jgi:hypothetical protein